MVTNGSPLSDPAVGAGFAAAYDGDPWQSHAPVEAAEQGPEEPQAAAHTPAAPDWADEPAARRVAPLLPPGPVGLVAPEPGPAGQHVAQPVPVGRHVAPPDPGETPASPSAPVQDLAGAAHPVSSGPATRAALARPRLPAHRPVGAARRPASRALRGAAVAVGGVVLGIASLLWVTDEPPRPEAAGGSVAPTAQAATEQGPTGRAPTLQAAPVEGETAPPDSSALSSPPALPGAPPAQEPPPPPPPPPAAAAAKPASPVIPVTVLNNSRTTGLADRAAQVFRSGGWPVAETGNFTGRIRATTVYYAPGQEESARVFVRRFPGVERVLPRFDGLPGSGLTVVLTSDYA